MGSWFAKTRQFIDDTVEEMHRCTWTPKDQLLESTMLVIVALVIMAAYVAAFDQLFFYTIKYISTI